MSMQTKIAFKVDEIKRKNKAKSDSNNDNNNINMKQKEIENVAENKDENKDENEDEMTENEEEEKDINPFFREPLYIGNLCLPSSSDKYYRWIVFISTSSSEIIAPKSIKCVTYILHPTFPHPKRNKTKSPFFLDICGWGIFQIDIIIKFKNNFIRPSIETAHMLSVDALTSITCIEDGSREFKNEIFNYKKFKQFKNEKVNTDLKNSFVQKAKHRLKRNLLRTPSPVYFEGFNSKLPEFKAMLKQCISTEKRLIDIYKLDIPDIIYHIIGHFAVFSLSLYDIMPNQEVFIEGCTNSDIVISAAKFNHLRLRQCNNITIKFPYILSKCELIDCYNINVICTGLCYTYRFDTCCDIKLQFLDPGSRVTMLSFDSPTIILHCVGIQWQDHEDYNDDNKYEYPESLSYNIPYQKGERERLSIRWRGNKTPGFTWKHFHAKYTLGTSSSTT